MARNRRPDAGALLHRAEDIERTLAGDELADSRPFGWALESVGDGDATVAAVLLRGGNTQEAAERFVHAVCAVVCGGVHPEDGVGSGFIKLRDPRYPTPADPAVLSEEATATRQLVNLGVADGTAVTVVARTPGLRLFIVDETDDYALAVCAVAGNLASEDISVPAANEFEQ